MLSVLIIESPGLTDITTGDREGELLAQELRLLRIPCEYMPIHTSSLLGEVLEKHSSQYGVIHISCHGNKGGIGFTDQTSIDWNNLQPMLLPYVSNRLAILSACHSASFKPDQKLSEFLSQLSSGQYKPPICVFTMFGEIYIAESVLAWGLFYCNLSKLLKDNPISSCTARMIYHSLNIVRNANLPKICAAHWYDKKYVDISPWKENIAIDQIDKIEKGLPVDSLPI